MTDKEQIEVIPPGNDTLDIDELTTNKDRVAGMALVTVGQIKKEMGVCYRLAQRGRIPWAIATKAIWILRQMLKACEIERRYFIPPEADADDRPVFVGLTIVGPSVDKLMDGTKPKRGKGSRNDGKKQS